MNAVFYELDIKSFQDSNGDGIGDLQGLLARLPYLKGLGVDCLWLQPFYPSPKRDNGYDVTDHCAVDPALGTLQDFQAVITRARELDLRVILDLPLNHTSNQHPWFLNAREDPASPYRSHYIWADHKPENPAPYPVFGETQGDNWEWDEAAGQYYFHTFYPFMPDLNMAHEPVCAALLDILRFWLQQGVHGFRLDALPFLLLDRAKGELLEEPHAFLRRLRAVVEEHCPDGVLLAEVDKRPEETAPYFGEGDETQLILNFYMCNHLFLALATGEARHIVRAWEEQPPVPPGCNWATFLRNHDELSLAQLSEHEQHLVFEAFAPDPDARAFGRGIRRRLAPMLGGNLQRLKLAYSLLFTLPGAVVLNLGEELGMGDDLSLPERESVRTPMQWSAGPQAGFSDADAAQLYRPVVASGPFRHELVNVERQEGDPASMLNFIRACIQASKDAPAFSHGDWTFLDSGNPGVLAHSSTLDGRPVYALHNLSAQAVTVTLDLPGNPAVFLGSDQAGPSDGRITLEPYGFRWLRQKEKA